MPERTVDLFGIPNCDQVKKARSWLAEHGIPARFHDFKKEPPSPRLLEGWLSAHAWEDLVNRRGTTWRGLDEHARPRDRQGAVALMLATPSVIKRPVLVVAGHIEVGFDANRYATLLS